MGDFLVHTEWKFNSRIDGITTFETPGIVVMRVSGAGGSHPNALQDPYVTVSRHTAPTVQSMAEIQIPKTQTILVHGVQCDPTNGLP